MKINMKKVFCIAIMTVMLFSTMGIGAFAAIDSGAKSDSASNQVDEEQSAQEPEDSEVVVQAIGNNSSMTDSNEQEIPENLANVANLKTLAGHQRIKISWDRLEVEVPVSETTSVEGTVAPETKAEVDRYIVMRSNNGAAYEDYCTVKVEDGNATAEGKISSVEKTDEGYYVEDLNVGDGLIDYDGSWGRNGGTFKYKVIAQKDYAVETSGEDQTVTVSSDVESATASSNTCVRTSYVKLKLKTKKKLKSHDKKRISKTFAKGRTIYTCSFGIGQHMFIYKDHMFWLNRISTKKESSGYVKSPIYAESAEYFVNSRPNKASKTDKLIWVSTYTQRLYIFNKEGGQWKLANGKGWSVSTGKAKTPTIRTIDPKTPNLDSGRKIGKQKNINKKLKKRHGIPYWNCFSSYNAIHGKKAKWSINSIPKSGGCVRNTNDNALWVYKNCPKGTGVILF